MEPNLELTLKNKNTGRTQSTEEEVRPGCAEALAQLAKDPLSYLFVARAS